MTMKTPVHPGCIVKTCLEDLELSVTAASKVLGVTRPTVSRILNEHSAVSPEMAIRLSKAFGSTPEFWLRLQRNYDLAQARNKEANKTPKSALMAAVHETAESLYEAGVMNQKTMHRFDEACLTKVNTE